MPRITWNEHAFNKPKATAQIIKGLANLEAQLKGARDSGTDKNWPIYCGATNQRETADWMLVKVGALLRLKKSDSFLDIGCGDWKLGEKVAKETPDLRKMVFAGSDENAARPPTPFMHIEIMDKPQQKSDPQQETYPPPEIIRGGMDCIKGETFDLVLLAHRLYWEPRDSWLSFIANAYQYVAPEGVMVVIMHGEKDPVAGMVKALGGTPNDIEGLALSCAKEFGNKKTYFHRANTWSYAQSEFGMSELFKFLSMGTGADIAGVQGYAERLLNGDCYQILKYDKAIVVRKDA